MQLDGFSMLTKHRCSMWRLAGSRADLWPMLVHMLVYSTRATAQRELLASRESFQAHTPRKQSRGPQHWRPRCRQTKPAGACPRGRCPGSCQSCRWLGAARRPRRHAHPTGARRSPDPESAGTGVAAEAAAAAGPTAASAHTPHRRRPAPTRQRIVCLNIWNTAVHWTRYDVTLWPRSCLHLNGGMHSSGAGHCGHISKTAAHMPAYLAEVEAGSRQLRTWRGRERRLRQASKQVTAERQ